MALLAVGVKTEKTALALVMAKGDAKKTTLSLQQRRPLVVRVGTKNDTSAATIALLVAKVGTIAPELAFLY